MTGSMSPPGGGGPFEGRPDPAIAPEDMSFDGLDRWMAETQVDEAIAQRRRTAWLRRQDDEASTLAGVLADLAERGGVVVVAMVSGRRHRGRVLAVGAEVIELRPVDGHLSNGTVLVLALAAVMSVRSHPDDEATQGERPSMAADLSMATALGRRAGDRAAVVVVAVNGEVTSGSVLAVGADVLTLRVDGGGVAYVPLASVSEVAVPESG